MNKKTQLPPKFLLFFAGFLLSIAILAACSGEPAVPPTPVPPTATPIPPTPTPSPADIVREAGAAMSDLDAVRFTINRTGGRAFVDAEQQITLNEALGIYKAPDSAAAELDVSGLGLNLKVQTIAIGEDQWLTSFLTQQWEALPDNLGFNPADIFGPDGFKSLLDENVTDVSAERSESIDGVELSVFDITVEGDRVSKITAGIASSSSPVELTVWVDRNTNLIHQISFETPSDGDEPIGWLLKFTNFNEPVEINAPVQ